MRIRPAAIPLALCAALPAPARADLAADYAALHRQIPLSLTADPARQMEWVAALAGRVQGRWFPLSWLSKGGDWIPDAETVARGCTTGLTFERRAIWA